MNSTSEFPGIERPDGFLVVGIGASAGGIQALRDFFQHVPPNSGMAYVVILHLSPDHDSQLASVLQVVASIPVYKVVESTQLEPDHIYVVPPNQHLVIKDGFIAASPNIHIEERRAPVDIFFRNLADIHGSRAVCVILSGTGANGSMGLKRIKEMGGVAYVQNPREAEFNEMPRNAIATELVDEVLPVAEIPQKLLDYRNSLGTVEIIVEAENRPEAQQQALRDIFAQLRIRTGHDFSNYKRATLLRRIERRINIRNLPDLPTYATFLTQSPEEAKSLLRDLLISVTNFFRDSKPFLVLQQEILPSIFRDKKSEDQVRIWVAGCATGEEAYSIAMLCAEQIGDGIDSPVVQIFATDIDETAISTAREGYYSLNDAADVSPERLRRFFHADGDGFRVRREVREMILFANHNFLKDPPFSRVDLVSCRNVLIYLNSTAQERVMETFHFALKPGGYLFLGTSESVDGAADLYTTFSRENHIHRAREVSAKNFPVPVSVPTILPPMSEPPKKLDSYDASPKRMSFGDLHQKLLEEYAPPSVVINEEYEIVHLSENVGKFFQLQGGEPTQNLLKIVKPELRLELRSALFQAVQYKMPVEARGLALTINGQPQTVDILIRPVLKESDTSKGFILVMFEQHGSDLGPAVMLSSEEPVAKQLEEELIVLKQQLRHSVEHHEFQAEELRATNEELQAINEELRSSTEELETSKEELQSINEELRTVNQELKVKIEETSHASNNLQNLINSAAVATIFLDRSFRIRMFTPAVLGIFNLIPSDHGRPITDITNKLTYLNLVQDAESVLEKLAPVDREVATTDHRHFLMRLLPYRTAQDSINGIVITFYEITERKEAEKALERSEEHLRLLIESAKDYAIFTMNAERQIVSWSVGAETITGFSESEVKGQTGDIIFTPQDKELGVPMQEAAKAIRDGRAENERWHMRKNGSFFWASGSVSTLQDRHGKLVGFVKILRDLTATRQLEEAKFFLASIVESSNDSIITIDFNRKITSWNKAAEHLYGYTSAEAIGKNLTMLTLPADLLKILSNVDKIEHSKEVATFDTVRLRKDDRYLDLEIVMSPVLNASGEAIGISTIARDISERKRREAHLAFLADLSEELIGLSIAKLRERNFTEKIAAFFQATACVFTESQKSNQRRAVLQQWYRKGSAISGVDDLPDFRVDAIHKMAVKGQSAIVHDIASDSRIKDSKRFLAKGIASFVNIPLTQSDEWQLSLSLYLDHAHNWPPDELSLLQEIGMRIWNSVERARAEEALRTSDERFRTLTDAIPQVVWANDENGKANYFNKRWYEYSGLTYEESYGLGWEAIVHPDDAPASKEKWHQALAEGKIFDAEYRLRNRNGEYCWHIGRNVPLKRYDGNVIGWFGSATDIEGLKRTEGLLRQTAERLQLALDTGELGTFEHDLDTGQTICTDQHKRNFGYADNESCGLDDLTALSVPEDRGHVEAVIRKVIADQSMYSVEYRIKARGRDIRWIKLVGSLIPGEQGKAGKIVGITLDITEQKLFTQELQKQVSERTLELQRSNEDLRQFAHVASHDLKEPVRKIKTFKNRIVDEFASVLPEKVKAYLDKIEDSTNRMYAMVDGVLSYAKLGNSFHAFKPIDLNNILGQIEIDLEVAIQAKNAVITRAEMPSITGSEVLIYQLFYNLIMNSLKFSKVEQPVSINIGCDMERRTNIDMLKITVTDNGIGFDPEFNERVFDTFARLNPAEDFEGTGLGLALCKKIVERHHGFISASSRENEGATFTILLPLS